MSKNKRRYGDRKEGRLIRSLPPFYKLIPYMTPRRCDRCNQHEESFEISVLDKRLRQLRVSGYKEISVLHFLIAAYIRAVSMMPGLNRFVAGRRVYARNNIEIVLSVRQDERAGAPVTNIKVSFDPTDTIFDVYRKINERVSEIRASEEGSTADEYADMASRLPRFLLRFTMSVLKFMDYYGWLPEGAVNASPFHGSMAISDLGSLGVSPVYHHIYNFGTLPMYISFGAKRHSYELNRKGEMLDKKYVDCKLVMDEGIVDTHYYAQLIQAFKVMFNHPEIVETPPGKVIDDIY